MAPFIAFKYRSASADERRRVTLFLLALLIGFCLPMLDLLIGAFFPQCPSWSEQHPLAAWRFFVSNFLYAMFAVTTTYTVLAHRVFDVRAVARSAVRHLLARYTAIGLILVPFAFLAFLAGSIANPRWPSCSPAAGRWCCFPLAALGALALHYRQRLLDFIDRRFFRERYNARRVLTELADQVRAARNSIEVSRLIGQGVNLALHLERVSLLVETPAIGRFVDPLHQVRQLDPGSQLITLVAASREPIAVELESSSSPFHSLPEDESSGCSTRGPR